MPDLQTARSTASVLGLVVALTLPGGCGGSSDDRSDAPGAPTSGSTSRDARGGAAVEPVAAATRGAASVLPDLEARLSAAAFELPFTVAASGAVDAEIEGSLATTPDHRARLEARGTFAGTAIDLTLVSDGTRMVMATRTDTVEAPTPVQLQDALIVGLTRMGVLHNVARLTGPAPPDHAGGGVREWVLALDPGPAEIDGWERPGLGFELQVAGEDVGSGVLLLDEDGAPVERVQTVRFPDGEMRVVERYGVMTTGSAVDETRFRIPPSSPGG